MLRQVYLQLYASIVLIAVPEHSRTVSVLLEPPSPVIDPVLVFTLKYICFALYLVVNQQSIDPERQEGKRNASTKSTN